MTFFSPPSTIPSAHSPTSSQSIERTVIAQIEEMTVDWDWDDELDEPTLSASSRLIGDLDFASVDFVQLFVAIEIALGRKFGFHDLIMPADTYVDDLSVVEIVAYIQARLTSDSGHPMVSSPSAAPPLLPTDSPLPPSAPAQPKLTAEDFAQFQRLIPIPPAIAPPSPRNPPAVFILSSPRSGSTLFRVMLAGHPQLFSPPELHLLTYETLAQRQQSLENDLNRHLLGGTIQAIQQAQGCSADEAVEQMQDYITQNLSIQQFYGTLQQSLGDRLLIDKTPSYAYHLHLLQRIEALFENPLYIHLTRHPYGMIRSFTDAKLDQLVPFLRNSPFSPQQRAELIWQATQQNIQTFLRSISPQRQLHIRYEDLIETTEPTLQQVCQFLQVPFNAAVLNPYESVAQRMTGGLQTGFQVGHAGSAPMSGDLKFHLHRQIEPGMAHRWRQFHTDDFLSDATVTLARTWRYEV